MPKMTLDASYIVNLIPGGATHTQKLLCKYRCVLTFVLTLPPHSGSPDAALTRRDNVSLHCRLIPHSSVISERSSSSNSSRLMSWVSLVRTETKLQPRGPKPQLSLLASLSSQGKTLEGR